MTSKERLDLIMAGMRDACETMGVFIVGGGFSTSFSDIVPAVVGAAIGQLITEKYGPRVRIGKVFTDLQLVPDESIDIGVQHFCEICGKCAHHCPSQAIPKGERTDQPQDISTNPGILKWPVHTEKCLTWWHKSGTTGCTNCIRVCPYNKPPGMVHTFVREILKRTSLFDRLVLKGDDLMGYGKQIIRETPNTKAYG